MLNMEFNYVDRYIKRKGKECRQSTLDQYKSTIVRFLSGIAEEKNRELLKKAKETGKLNQIR